MLGHGRGAVKRETRRCCILPAMPQRWEGGAMPDLLDFDEALRQVRAAGGPIHLLLGNGFSTGAHDGFRYDSLYEEARTSLPKIADAVFQKYGTTNFEQVLQKMYDANWIAEAYGIYHDSAQRVIQEDHERVKEALISAVRSVHPRQFEYQKELVHAEQFFLNSNFRCIFTLCYDMMLYWVMNLHAKDKIFYFQDGFRGQPPEFDKSQNQILDQISVFFLHGALHFFRMEGKVRKLVQNEQSWILDQVEDRIASNTFPVIVTEGTSLGKRSVIEGSSYLEWAFSRFRRLNGNLFTYGTSLSEHDAHISKAISDNCRLKSLFVGIHTEPESQATDLKARVQRMQEERRKVSPEYPLDVYFYDSSTAPVWGPTGD